MLDLVAAIVASLQFGAVSPPIPTDQAESIAAHRGGQPVACPAQGPALQVLGSGGPLAEGPRAGTSYLLRIDGRPRLLIDAGAGSFLRYAEAGVALSSLDAIALTHLHADHAGDLPGILKSGSFEGRTAPLQIFGPDSAPRFPATSEFIARLVDGERGAFAYLGGYTDGSEDKPMLAATDIATQQGEAEPTIIAASDDYRLTAIPVHHGLVPALGYKIDVGNKTIVISGDQSFLSEGFATVLAASAPDLLLVHHVVPEGDGQPRGLHRQPGSIGELAAGLAAHRLVLTHNMNRSLAAFDLGLAAIRVNYAGDVVVADDMDCFAL